MSHTVTLAEAKARLEDLIEGARRGEEWLITNGEGQLVAKLAAIPLDAAHVNTDIPSEADHSSLIGLMPGIKFLPGWDDPLEEFEEYM